MKEIRLHGRGGQGAVTAAYILATAAFNDGKFTQAFPRFGVERRGAPVEAFVRISDSFIRRKSAVYEPDILLILDSTLFDVIDVTQGLKDGGMVIINTEKSPNSFGIENATVHTVDATSLAFDILKRDIVNTAMLAAFAAFTGDVKTESISEGIKEHFSGTIAQKNIELVEKTYQQAMEKK